MSASNKYGYWIHSSKFTALTKFSNLFINLLSFILLARLLDKTSFGVWGIFISMVSTIDTARISLIRNAFIRFMNQSSEGEHESLQASALVVSLAISAVLSVAFLLLAPYIAAWLNAPGLDVMLRWYAFTIFVSTILSQCEMSLTATMNFRSVSFIYIIRQGTLLVVIALYYFFHLSLSATALSLYYLLSVFAASFAGLHFARHILVLGFRHYKKWLRQLWGFGKYVFGTNVAAQLFRSTDTYLTSAFISPAVSALYNASNRISNFIDIPSQVLSDVAFTKAARIDSSDTAAVRNMYEKTTGAIMVFSLPALLILLFFPELILHVLAGDAFLSAAPILRITAFFGFVLPFLKQYGTMMDATGHPHINFRTNLLALALNVLFNYIGIRYWGFLGSAYGTATMYLCIFFVTQRILYRRFGVRVWRVFVNTFAFYPVLFGLIRSYIMRKPFLKKALGR